jgi:hypothetical protein
MGNYSYGKVIYLMEDRRGGISRTEDVVGVGYYQVEVGY